jgi:hypothetical protein
MNYTPSNKLLKIFKNKRVAIVGPSPHLIGTKSGPVIDQYDIVCRVNQVAAIDHEEDYGARTDIVFHNCGTQFIDAFDARLKESAHISRKLKLVICPCVKATGSDNNWPTWPDNHISPVVENFHNINSYNIPFSWIGIPNYRKVYNLFKCEPNAGQTAILMILKHNPAELFVTGFSFYAQGNMPSQCHISSHTVPGIEKVPTGDLSHPQIPQIRVFKNKILKDYVERVTIDSYMNELLGCDHSHVYILS